jgi:hypothetical protein
LRWELALHQRSCLMAVVRQWLHVRGVLVDAILLCLLQIGVCSA